MGRRAPDPGLEVVRQFVREALSSTSPAATLIESLDALVHPTEYETACYLERTLSPSDEEAFERHVAFCPQCAEELVLASRTNVARRSRTPQSWRIAAALALAIGTLISAVLAGRFVGHRMEASVLAGLESIFGGKASATGASLSLLNGPGVDLEGLTIHDPNGGEPMITSPSARFHVNLASLSEGEVGGTLELDRPVISVVHEASGKVNIDALLPNSKSLATLVSEAATKAVEAVTIRDGTLRIVDLAGGTGELRMADVDAEVTDLSGTAPAKLHARAGIESPTQNLGIVGTVGPWGKGVKPAYRFSEVAMDSVPMRAWPTMRNAMRGGLSFTGSLASAGDTWGELMSSVSGKGQMVIVSGALLGHNFIRETVQPLLGEAAPGVRLAKLMAPSDTSFDQITGDISVRRSGLQAGDLSAFGTGYRATGRGSVESSGQVDFSGMLTVESDLANELIALAPPAGALLDQNGEIAIPFRLAGTWPSVKARVEVERIAQKVLPLDVFAFLWRALTRPFLG